MNRRLVGLCAAVAAGLAFGAFDGAALAQQGARNLPAIGPAGTVERSSELFAGFRELYEGAVKSLDEANEALDRAIMYGNYKEAIDRVDEVLNNVLNLVDKIQPGNPTEARTDRAIKEIDGIIARLRDDTGLRDEDRDLQITGFEKTKSSLLKTKAELAVSHGDLVDLADRLRSSRKALAYAEINAAYAQAADSLAAASARIAEVVKSLRAQLDRMRPILTN